MHRKLLLSIVMLSLIMNLYASQNHRQRYDFNEADHRFLDEQILKLKKLGLSTTTDDALWIFLIKQRFEISMKIGVGVANVVEHDFFVSYNTNYYHNDDARKILSHTCHTLLGSLDSYLARDMHAEGQARLYTKAFSG